MKDFLCMPGRNKADKRIVTAVSLVLSAGVWVLFVCAEMYGGLFNPAVFKASLQKSDFGMQLEAEVVDKHRELFEQYGLPESLAEEMWDENELYMAFLRYAENGEEKDTDFGQKEIIDSYLQSQNVYITESVEEAVNKITKESKEICQRYVYPSFVKEYYRLANKAREICKVVLAIAGTVCACCMVCIFLWSKKKYHAFEYISGSSLMAVIWNLVELFFIKNKGFYVLDGIKTEYYRAFLEMYQNRVMWSWYGVMAVAVVLSFGLLYIAKVMRKHNYSVPS